MAEEPFIFAFGPYRLDTGMHTLSNGNEPIALEPLPFDVLITLVESAPNFVTRRQLFEKHWAGLEVTDNVLDQVIATLRREFRRQPDGDKYLRTVSKRGYRFSVGVQRLSTDARNLALSIEKPDISGNAVHQEDDDPREEESDVSSKVLPAKIRPRVTDDDIELLGLVHDYSFVQVAHLKKLTGRSSTMVNERLLKLFEQRYLDRRELPDGEDVYVIGKAGMRLLVERGSAAKEGRDRRQLKPQGINESSIRHLLMITDIHVTLALACHAGSIRLVTWKLAEELQDHLAGWQAGQRERLLLRPDGFFTLEDTERPAGHNRVHFFLDVDKSSTTKEQFQKKTLGYWQYQTSGRYTERYKLRSFRVVTFTNTHERAEDLTQLTFESLPKIAHRHFLFGTLMNASGDVLSDVFLRPLDFRTGARHRLVPPKPTAAQHPSVRLSTNVTEDGDEGLG